MGSRDDTKRSLPGLIRTYGMGLIKHAVTWAVAVIDVIAYGLVSWRGFVVPQWVYWVVLAGGILWAGFSLYREEAHKRLGLEGELARIREREPSLRLCLVEEDELKADLSVIVPIDPEVPDVEALISQRAEELEYRPPESKPSSLAEIALATSGMMTQPTSEQLEGYREQVSEYLDEYRNHLELKYSYEHLVCRSRQIQLAVDNKGNAPANSVVVRFFFPDEVKVLEPSEFPEEPQEPKKPPLPRGILDIIQRLGEIPSPLRMYPLPTDIEFREAAPDVIGPIIEPDKSTNVTYEIKKVMHNLPERSLDPLVLVFPAERSDRIYEIPYEIHCDELPGPESGALRIDVRYEREEQAIGLIPGGPGS